MYKNSAVTAHGIDADLIYVHKVKASLAELNALKENAINTENYILADQTRQKILALQAQLVKMEHQLNADILINSITAWQSELAKAIAVTANFPLKEPAHKNFTEVINILPNNYYDSMIRSLLLCIPHDIPDVPKSPFGWEVILRKIPNLSKQQGEVIEGVKSSFILSILDALIRFTNLLNTSNLKRDTHTLMIKHAFFYMRSAASKRVNAEYEARMFEQIGLRWSIIVGDLAALDRTEIISQIMNVVDPAKKAPNEEIVMVLSATRYISFRPRSEKDAHEVADLIREYVNLYEKTKKAVVRLSVIQALERLIQPLELVYGNHQETWEMVLHAELISHLLSTSTVEQADNYYIGLKALRIILDNDSGFQANAVCRVDPLFSQLMKEIPYEFESSLIRVLQFCDNLVGVSVFGQAGVVFEPEISTLDGSSNMYAMLPRTSTFNQGRRPSSVRPFGSALGHHRTENLYARGEDDLLVMLSDALDKTSLHGPSGGSDNGIPYEVPPTSTMPVSPRGPSRGPPDTPRLDIEERLAYSGSTLGRSSVLGAASIIAEPPVPNISPSLTDSAVKEANSKVAKAISGWYSNVGQPTKSISKWIFSSSLTDQSRVKRAASVGMVNEDSLGLSGQKMRPEFALYIRIFKEVLKLVLYIPHPELVSGQLFIGSYLIHPYQDVAREAAGSLQKIFGKFPEIRLRRFAEFGRPKALRHCAKLLKQIAIPVMTSVSTVDEEFVSTYSSYVILLMSLAGVPLLSEDVYTLESYISPDRLLFNHFKNYLSPILNSDNAWEVKAIIVAGYFTHRAIIQLYIVQLWQWYADMKQNTPERLNPHMLDNIVYVIRSLTQAPEFENIIREPAVFQSSTIDIISDFLRMMEGALNDVSFLTTGPLYRVRSAFNICTIVKRISDSIKVGRAIVLADREAAITAAAVAAALQGENPVRPSMMFDPDPPGLAWDMAPRRSVVMRFQEWYTIIEEVSGFSPPGTTKTTEDKLSSYRRRLLKKIGLAAESIFGLGDMFEGGVLQPEVLTWMAKVEAAGFKVFTPTMLYNYENALGTVLAHSYSGKGNAPTFTEAIFEQILPRYKESYRLFLTGEDIQVVSNEDYISMIHSLPTATPEAVLRNPNLIFPIIDAESAEKLRQNVGSLVFFGLYNLLSSDKMIRMKSFQFIRELLVMYNPDPSLDIATYINKFTGIFYTNIGINLKVKVLEISRLAADLFASDAPSFLWEAVRCSRSVQKAEKPLCIVPSQQWILELILPWCRFVNLSSTNEDIVFAEFFRYLMDAAFFKPQHQEQLLDCWTEVARAPEFGKANVEVFSEILVQICGKFDQLKDQGLALLSRIFSVHPEVVADSLLYHLSSSALPWKATTAPTIHRPVLPIVSDYVTILYTALNGTQPESGNGPQTSSKAAVALTSELLLQNFVAILPYLPILMNFVVLHLPHRLQESSSSTYLLTNMCEGYVSFLQHNGMVQSPEYASIFDQLKRTLVYLDSAMCIVDWDRDTTNKAPDAERYTRIPIGDFLQMLLFIFDHERPSLLLDFTRETLNWAVEGLLDPEHSVRAIETYTLLVKANTQVPPTLLNPLNARLLDHVQILAAIEADVIAKVSKRSAAPTSPQSPSFMTSPTSKDISRDFKWPTLPEGKALLKNNTECVISSILKLHNILISQHTRMGTLSNNPDLFWTSACLLHIPCRLFPDLWCLALDNCRLFLSSHNRDELKSPESLFARHFDLVQDTVPGLQPNLLQGLFSSNKDVQQSSFDLLLQGWYLLPEHIIDSSSVGLMYTILYCLTWIFANLQTDSDVINGELVAVDGIALLLQETLNSKSPLEFAGIIRCLQTLIDTTETNYTTLTPAILDDLLQKCASNLAQVYFPTYVHNVADFCGFAMMLGPTYSKVSLKMTEAFWAIANNSAASMTDATNNVSGAFKTLVKRLPFLQENQPVINALLYYVFGETAEGDDLIKEIDLTSSGKVDVLPEKFESPTGSVQVAIQALSLMGISPSTSMYSW
ncbi:hypothetical protein HDV05_000488 [Chytridiales sp. JEL 0842]|nr:hypothetical protein HDV05_000488 [Chytridiales sp. JEL 0842]